MGKIMDFKKEKQNIEEMDQLAENIEKAMQMAPSPAHEFYVARDKKQLAKLVKEYDTDDYIELAVRVSEDLSEETDEKRIRELIWSVYIVFNKLFWQYMTFKLWEVKDPPEYKEFGNTQTKEELIGWNLKIIKELKDSNADSCRDRFNGLFVFYMLIVEKLAEYMVKDKG